MKCSSAADELWDSAKHRNKHCVLHMSRTLPHAHTHIHIHTSAVITPVITGASLSVATTTSGVGAPKRLSTWLVTAFLRAVSCSLTLPRVFKDNRAFLECTG